MTKYKQLSHQGTMLAVDVSVPDAAYHATLNAYWWTFTFSALLVATKTGCFSQRADQSLAVFVATKLF